MAGQTRGEKVGRCPLPTDARRELLLSATSPSAALYERYDD